MLLIPSLKPVEGYSLQMALSASTVRCVYRAVPVVNTEKYSQLYVQYRTKGQGNLLRRSVLRFRPTIILQVFAVQH